ncbi:Cobyric acid synthase [Raoultella terrigena]|uniref:Cobyric acid synthase n=1 Tax=Raoultella terrigena TaxID=577 RepID=A0A4U9D162_RAOTE|nr:Cobyric acid synthase [Raoultella terrigena]
MLQAHQQGIPLLGICGGYQMLGETIFDDVESGLGMLPGLGLLNTVTHFARHKTTTLVEATMAAALPGWLAAPPRCACAATKFIWVKRPGKATAGPLLQLEKEGRTVADGAMTDDGLAFGTYLHGLFDSDDFTRALVNGLRQRKGLASAG